MNVSSPFMQLYSTFTNPFPGFSPIIGESLIGEVPESHIPMSISDKIGNEVEEQ
jgi:hypothetical protein